MKTPQSLAISQKADIVASSKELKPPSMLSFYLFLWTTMNNTTAENLNKTSKKSSGIFSKAKNLGRAVGFAVMGVLGAQEADAQYMEFGSIPDQGKTTVTLNAKDKQQVYWNEISPHQQHFQIIKVNTPDPADWRNNHEVIFSSSNDEIRNNQIGEVEIRRTRDINNKQARQWIFDDLAPGNYVIRAVIWADDTGWDPVFFVEVDANGNQKIFDGERIDENPIAYYWDNKFGGSDPTLHSVEHVGEMIHLRIAIPPIVDPASGEVGLALNPIEQFGDFVKVNFKDDSSVTVPKSDLVYNMDDHTLEFSVADPGQAVASVESQHEVIGPVEVIDGYVGVESLTQDQVVMYPNPVSGGQDIVFQLPSHSGNQDIAIYDMTGKLIQQDQISPLDNTVSHSLAPGIYFILIKDTDNGSAKPLSKKLIVQ